MSDDLIVVGNTVPSGHTAGRIFNTNGLSPTVMYRNSKVVQIEEETNNSERGSYIKEFKNEILKKLNFKMDEIKLFDSFAGIGSLHNSLQFLGVPTKIIGLSETDVDAIISYAGVHIDNFLKVKFDYPSEDEMRQLLINRNIGWSFEKQKSCIPRLKKDKLYKVYKATILLNNLGDISKINYDNMEDFDLFNMSFPCTDISGAGKQKGLTNSDGTHTRSGLVKYGIELIKVKKPKYIMIENVKALIQKKFIDDFYSIVNEIESYGYKVYYPTVEDKKCNIKPTCLNAKNYGIAQNRERIFIICVRNDINDNIDKFYEGFDSGLRLKDFLEDEVNEKYYLSKEIQDRFKLNGNKDEQHNELNVVGSSAPECRTIGQRDITYGTNGIMSTLTATDYKQPKQIINKTPFTNNNGELKEREDGMYTCLDTRYAAFPDNHDQRTGILETTVDEKYYIDKPFHISTDTDEKHDTNKIAQIDGINYKATRSVSSRELCCRTLDTMGGGQREPKVSSTKIYDFYNNNIRKDENIGTLTTKSGNVGHSGSFGIDVDYCIRKLTPKECWRLMGFTDEQFDKAKELGISDSQLYKQAGNSIVTNCLYYIFKELFKNYIVKE